MSPDEANLAVLRARPLRLGRSLLYYGTRSSTRQSRFYFRADRASALDRQTLRKNLDLLSLSCNVSLFNLLELLFSVVNNYSKSCESAGLSGSSLDVSSFNRI